MMTRGGFIGRLLAAPLAAFGLGRPGTLPWVDEVGLAAVVEEAVLPAVVVGSITRSVSPVGAIAWSMTTTTGNDTVWMNVDGSWTTLPDDSSWSYTAG